MIFQEDHNGGQHSARNDYSNLKRKINIVFAFISSELFLASPLEDIVNFHKKETS
jgi:hypothetical protein